MKIECPSCKLTGNINEATVPATGLAMTCPRCKANFTALRPVAGSGSAGAMVDSCPSCQYATFSEEKFSTCPKCGLVVADYLRKQQEARDVQKSRPQAPASGRPAHQPPPVELSVEQRKKEEESRRKYGIDKVAESQLPPEVLAVNSYDSTPLPVMIVGWITVIAGILLIIYGVSGLLEFAGKLKEAKVAIQAGDEALTTSNLVLEFGIIPAIIIVYSLTMIFFGSQFLLLKRWSLKALGFGAWAGICLAAVMELTDMIAWCRRASDSASIGYYATGILGGVLLAALWIVPLLVLAEYLKSEQFEKAGKSFV